MTDIPEKLTARVKTLAFAALTVISLFIVMWLPPITDFLGDVTSMLSIHLLMELFAIIISLLIVIVSWHTFDAQEARSANILICGFLIVASCDTVHALSYSGMPNFLAESSTPRAIFFWLMGRSFEVSTMALIAIEWVPPFSRKIWLYTGIFISGVVVWFGSYQIDSFPLTFVSGLGVTLFKASYEYALCFLNIAVALLFWRNAERTGKRRFYLLALSSFVMGIGELAFTAYVKPSDFQNIFGHTYKLVAYALLYRATFVTSIRAPFDEALRSENSLRANEQRLRTLTEAIPQQVWTANPDGVIDYVSSNVTNYFGLTPDELLGWSWEQAIHPDDLPETLKRWTHAIESGEPFEVEFRLKRALDQSYRWHLGKALPLKDTSGVIIKWFGTNTDITERKQAEESAQTLREQLSNASKMESVGHLTAGIAHDFNNILGAMMGYTELSKQMISSGKTDDIGRYHDEVLYAGNRAKELILQMLTFSRLPQNENPAAAPAILLAPIVKEVSNLLRSSTPSSIDLNYNLDFADLKAHIQPIQLHQIILNLGLNARDAMGEYGKIDISLSGYHGDKQLCSSCKHMFTGDYAMISVKDSGCGIPAQIMNHIFDPFFTSKGVGKGTGMGLSVVHGLVHGLGGHILVSSSTECGTTINILLPLASSGVASRETASVTPFAVIKGVEIMVVDDEQTLTTMLYDFLTAQGAHTITFTEPKLALESFIQNPDSIDLVITDETMPGMSGMLLAEKLLAVKPGLPIILCTGYSEHANAESARKIGIARFFNKPLNMHALLHTIQLLLKKQD